MPWLPPAWCCLVRDVWFVVGVPVFLYSQGWTFTMVGGFLAAWTIGYGLVQALAPNIVKRSPDGLSTEVPAARLWSALLAVVPMAIAAAIAWSRVYLGVHWPMDMLGGFLCGVVGCMVAQILWLFVGASVFPRLQQAYRLIFSLPIRKGWVRE